MDLELLFNSNDGVPDGRTMMKTTSLRNNNKVSFETTNATRVSKDVKNVTGHAEVGWVRPPVVYGLIHMAKTAGTELNGELANHFERVCGNKGYSYDAYQTNERTKNFVNSNSTELKNHNFKLTQANLGDIISRENPKRNRGRVGKGVMNEVGFEDCDYIAMETPSMRFWENVSSLWEMELHVPCRDPLDHLMSMCNFKNQQLHCPVASENSSNGIWVDQLERNINKCMGFMNRYTDSLKNMTNITLKCFDPMPPSRYIDYMGGILQRKRIESDYYHRNTNRPRKKERECIWSMGEEYQERVRSMMLSKYSYYRFCGECLGSEHELPLNS